MIVVMVPPHHALGKSLPGNMVMSLFVATLTFTFIIFKKSSKQSHQMGIF